MATLPLLSREDDRTSNLISRLALDAVDVAYNISARRMTPIRESCTGSRWSGKYSAQFFSHPPDGRLGLLSSSADLIGSSDVRAPISPDQRTDLMTQFLPFHPSPTGGTCRVLNTTTPLTFTFIHPPNANDMQMFKVK